METTQLWVLLRRLARLATHCENISREKSKVDSALHIPLFDGGFRMATSLYKENFKVWGTLLSTFTIPMLV